MIMFNLHRVQLAGLLLAALGASVAHAASYHVKRLTSDLHIPVAAVMAPGDPTKIYIAQLGGVASDSSDSSAITQSRGRVVVYDRVTGTVNYNTPFLNIADTSLTDPYGVPEVGLFSMVFHPNYQTNGKFYVNVAINHTGPAPVVDTRTSPFKTVLREYTVNLSNNSIASSRTIFELAQPAANHNGSWIGFNPLEVSQGKNYLYITQGDGGDQHDPANYGQNFNSWFGSVMRVDVDTDSFPSDSLKNYGIPATNPYATTAGADEVWAKGLRNPWRASFDRVTGDMWIGDVGQGRREEIDFILANSAGGQNFGWRLREGSVATPTGGVGGAAPAGNVNPVYDYLHLGLGGDQNFAGNSVTGGYVYRGPIAELYGRYFFADNVSGHIWSLDPTNPTGTVQRMNTLFTPDTGSIIAVSSFGEDEQGNLLIVDGAGALFQVMPNLAATLTIDRSTGQMSFTNASGAALNVKSYTLTSATGAIQPTLLTPIAGHYDKPPTGNGSVDPNNTWQVTSPAGSKTNFAEQSTGAAANWANGLTFSLSAGGAWIRSPLEDLQLTLTFGNGTSQQATVAYTGNSGVAFAVGDLNFDGAVNAADWPIYAQNLHTNLAGLSSPQRYGQGDFDRDGDNDYTDFRAFEAAYNAANGAGALASLIAVPEPAAGMILIGMLAVNALRVAAKQKM